MVDLMDKRICIVEITFHVIRIKDIPELQVYVQTSGKKRTILACVQPPERKEFRMLVTSPALIIEIQTEDKSGRQPERIVERSQENGIIKFFLMPIVYV